jgi:hypothetical protein
MRDDPASLGQIGLTRRCAVRDYRDGTGLRMQLKGNVESPFQIVVFRHSGDVFVTGNTTGAEVVDAAEDHRYFWKKFVSIFQKKIEGVVVRTQNNVKDRSGIFVRQKGPETFEDLFGRMTLGIHVFHKQFRFGNMLFEDLFHSRLDVVRPWVAAVIGVEYQDVFGGAGAGRQQQKYYRCQTGDSKRKCEKRCRLLDHYSMLVHNF